MASKEQLAIIEKLRQGSVIGELSNKVNGRYELFTRKQGCFEPKSWNDHNFIIRRLNKNTVFSLLALGYIKKDNSIEQQMRPFGRDCWYVYNIRKVKDGE